MKCHIYKRPSQQLRKLPKNIQRQIMQKLEYYLNQNDPLKFAKRLSNFDLGRYRFRIGDYRVTFDVENDTVNVLLIDHRREVYKKS